ncbi:MAG: hypothetical protein WB500_13375 [Rhodoplanes sp.]|jgi:CRISPR-associated endonuclease/helicase Cas3
MRERLRSLCLNPEDDASPLAISTLRGEHADNREWQADPARPGIIVGTVGMIGGKTEETGGLRRAQKRACSREQGQA